MAAKGRTRDNMVPSEARRAQARSLAAEMFFERGYESTTMREIARALDIKVASLYYHFPDKEQILFELIDSVMGQLSAGLQDVIRGEKDPDVQLAAVVVNHVVLHALRPREHARRLRAAEPERRAARGRPAAARRVRAAGPRRAAPRAAPGPLLVVDPS